MNLSVIIISKNSEKTLDECLKSVEWADEIIILDSGSTDKTLEIGRRYTDKIFSTDWPGFGVQKQRALSKASCEWVLSLDTDEVIPLNLKEEIQDILRRENTGIDGYYLPRLSYIGDRPVRFNGWFPDYILRLFKKDKSHFTDALVHEKVICSGKTEKLENYIVHYSYENLEQVIEKMNLYSSLGAKEAQAKGKTSGVFYAFSRGLFSFFKSYILKRGFLGGGTGLIVAIAAFENSYYKYLKLGFQSRES